MKKFMKNMYTYTLIILAWFMIMVIGFRVAKLEQKIEWLEAQQDNVIETLITGNEK